MDADDEMRFLREQTAEQLGVIVRYHAGIERGEHNLSLDTVEALTGKLALRATLALEKG